MITMKRPVLVLSLALCAPVHHGFDQPCVAQAARDGSLESSSLENWAGFRGPGGNGHAPGRNPPLAWSVKEDKNILWKTKVPKRGLSSPVVWGNRLFLTGADDSSRQIYCFDTETGKLLWEHDTDGISGAPRGEQLPHVMSEPGFAAPTMTSNGRFVAAIFANGDLVCLNPNGERVWAQNLGVPRNHYGHASSLINHENLLFVQYDQNEGSQLLAFDLASGNLVWKVNRSVISWSSPILIDNQGRKELILTNSKAVSSYDPKTGKLFWQVDCLKGEVAPSAAYAGGLVCVANEYALACAIDVANHGAEPKILWRWDEILPDIASPLATEKYLLVPSGFGVVNCLEVRTGKVLWEHEFDAGFNSSPILVNDRVYVADLSGTVHVFRMAETFTILGASDLGEEIHATPAFVGDRIFIRGVTHLFCIAEKK